ncbi:MAG TPA: DNA polymerase III [Cyanobacteria bacterium UBA8803]|nr:DNA polymerase III [Cyanobacteria bacterium UBA9273]HBL62250.1 DNA polymerase III [Cyanobacteria bacterium UBA8803]
MSKKLDRIIVVDVEATCWQGKPPPKQENEIIEIGICVVDIASGKPIEKESILVKPERSVVSEFCTKLTTLTQEQVDKGISFAAACTILQEKYLSDRRVWASYGEYDKNQFEKQCQSRCLRYPFGQRHINVKTLFAIIHALPHEVGMAQALEFLNLPLEGTHHRGGDDAWNIGRILSQLLWQRSAKL